LEKVIFHRERALEPLNSPYDTLATFVVQRGQKLTGKVSKGVVDYGISHLWVLWRVAIKLGHNCPSCVQRRKPERFSGIMGVRVAPTCGVTTRPMDAEKGVGDGRNDPRSLSHVFGLRQKGPPAKGRKDILARVQHGLCQKRNFEHSGDSHPVSKSRHCTLIGYQELAASEQLSDSY